MCSISLFLYSSLVNSQQYSRFDQQLDDAYKIRTLDVEQFSKLLNAIKSEYGLLSNSQQDYFRLLKGYEYWHQGNLDKAINQYKDLERDAQNVEMQFRASLALVNLFSMEKKWLQGFGYLEKITNSYTEIDNKEYRHLGLIAASIFYNELEQYDMTQMYAKRLFDDGLSGKNLCLMLSVKIKADLFTSSIELLEQDILDAIQNCKKIHEIIPINILRTYLATYYLNNNQSEKAIKLLEKNLAEIKNTHYKLLIAITNSILADANLKSNHIEKARKYANAVIKDVDTNDYIKGLISAYQVLASIALGDGEFKIAFEYQENYIRINKVLFEQTIAKQMAVESAKHHAIERDNEIDDLKRQKQIKDLELFAEKQKLKFWVVGFLTIVILISFWFFRRNAKRELERQKQANWELQELDKLKDAILTNTSHELRTPLNGIIGLSDLILLEYEASLDEELIKSIRLIGKSGATLALVVNDILDLAQLKTGRMSINYQSFNISNLINDVIDLCRPLRKSDDVTIKLVETSKNISICQDIIRIQQVLFNLIGNAIKFTRSGEIIISCEQKSDYMWFHISDTGIGIPAEKVERVFKGFEQVDYSDSKEYQGTGLGLAICLETVTLLGGKIELRSELGKGTLVSFYVPVSPSC